MGVTEQGLAAIVKTRGNQDVHVILRGGTRGPNFAGEHVQAAAAAIAKARPGHHPSIMIDCSRTSLLFCSLRFFHHVVVAVPTPCTSFFPFFSTYLCFALLLSYHRLSIFNGTRVHSGLFTDALFSPLLPQPLRGSLLSIVAHRIFCRWQFAKEP